ncbi:conserved hypothetical protein [Burkholderia pseudomallei 576]|nr:conserved hypothetical protein [Burkholderia pseudomallei 576]
MKLEEGIESPPLIKFFLIPLRYSIKYIESSFESPDIP